MQSHRKKPSRRLGFSMMESLIAISVTAIAGGALLASLGAATQASSQAVDALVARGLAEQLMDEISATRFPNDLDTRLISRNRIEFNDIDDYHNWKSFPPVDRYGFTLGTEGLVVNDQRSPRNSDLQFGTTGLVNLMRTVSVESVGSDGMGGWITSSTSTNSRRITVRVINLADPSKPHTLAELTRIISNVPVSP